MDVEDDADNAPRSKRRKRMLPHARVKKEEKRMRKRELPQVSTEEKQTRKRVPNAPAMDVDWAVPEDRSVARGSIGSAVLPDKMLHAEAQGLDKERESWAVSPMSVERAHSVGADLLPRVVTLASGSGCVQPAHQAHTEEEWDVPTEESELDGQDDMQLTENENTRFASQCGGDGKTLASGSGGDGKTLASGSAPKEVELSWSVHKTPEGTIKFCGVTKGSRRPMAASCEVKGHAHRREFLRHASILFGEDLLQDVSAGDMQRKLQELAESVKVIWTEFNKKAWGLEPGSLPANVCRDPPPEIYMPCDWLNFHRQYAQFRAWVMGFLQYPYASEIFHVSGYVVEK